MQRQNPSQQANRLLRRSLLALLWLRDPCSRTLSRIVLSPQQNTRLRLRQLNLPNRCGKQNSPGRCERLRRTLSRIAPNPARNVRPPLRPQGPRSQRGKQFRLRHVKPSVLRRHRSLSRPRGPRSEPLNHRDRPSVSNQRSPQRGSLPVRRLLKSKRNVRRRRPRKRSQRKSQNQSDGP